MPTYTFSPRTITGLYQYDWNDPTIWSLDAVPNGPNADVVIPVITTGSGGTNPISCRLDIAQKSYNVRSVSITNNQIFVESSLTINAGISLFENGVLNIGSNASASIGALHNSGEVEGYGTLTSPIAITNDGLIEAASFDGTLTLDVGGLTNNGSLSAVDLTTPDGGFTNFVGGTLTGGTYRNVSFRVGGTIVTDAADINSGLNSYDPSSGSYVRLQDSLRTIAPSGTLTIGTFYSDAYDTTTLDVEGRLVSANSNNSTRFTANTLAVSSTGLVVANGSLTANVTDNGLIQVAPPSPPYGQYASPNSALVINGSVRGSGTLEIAAAATYTILSRTQPETYISPTSLELNGAVSATVVFDDGAGTLILDQPGSFSGLIAPFRVGNQIELTRVALSSITGSSYAGDDAGGTLTIQRSGGATIALKFTGDYDASSFDVLDAGPPATSGSPPAVLVIVHNPQQTGTAFFVDGSRQVQSLVGTGSFNAINVSSAAGSGAVTVDLADGTVTKGSQVDAILTNIEGVQLGADPSTIVGLTTGTDVL